MTEQNLPKIFVNNLEKSLFETYSSLFSGISVVEMKIDEVEMKGVNNNIRAFYLLAHAELQGYIEFIAKFYLDYSIKKFKEDLEINYLLLFFVYHSQNKCLGLDFNRAQIDSPLWNKSFPDILDYHREKYVSEHLSSNNGIRDQDLVKIFFPLGISIETLRKMKTFTLLDSFGNTRGDYAHKPYHELVKGKQPIILENPEDIKKTIGDIIKDIRGSLIPEIEKICNIT